ncbi:hypothetical protein [Methanocella conradii]|uniref:hypothetical protein n=1 Tax=Methanocella conradii TaxID=1175444 RepID=UPI0020C6308E|nr:hypothetical protein [Methanocella conradii]
MYNQGFKQYYDEYLKQDDRLDLVKQVIDCEAFRPIIARVFDDGPGRAGRPHNDEVVTFRCLVLQAWYGLSDPGLDAQLKMNTCYITSWASTPGCLTIVRCGGSGTIGSDRSAR